MFLPVSVTTAIFLSLIEAFHCLVGFLLLSYIVNIVSCKSIPATSTHIWQTLSLRQLASFEAFLFYSPFLNTHRTMILMYVTYFITATDERKLLHQEQ